jgi:hypothetical protein
MNGSARVGLPWPSLLAFVRLVSNPRVFDRPDTVQTAWRQVEEWLDCGCAWIPEPSERHRETLATFLATSSIGRSSLPTPTWRPLPSSTG